MTSACPYPLEQVADYIRELNARRDDPYECVMFGFPWRKPNTALAEFKGPKVWHRDEWGLITDRYRAGRRLLAQRDAKKAEAEELVKLGLLPQAAALEAEIKRMVPQPYKLTIRSGHGAAKSAFFAMTHWWFKSTRLGSTINVTANTENQLRTKTMAEHSKWFQLCTNAYWWDLEILSIRPQRWFSEWIVKDLGISSGDGSYDYLAAIPWSKNNPDALAGTHNWNGMVATVDEGSNVADNVYDTLDGTYTEPIIDRLRLEASNPRRVTGRWAERHQKPGKYPAWRKVHLDVREIEDIDPHTHEEIIRTHGPNSYQAHVQVYGTFPPASIRQCISLELVERAQDRELVVDKHAPLYLGLDPAREGDDTSVFYFRRGRDMRSIEPIRVDGMTSDVVVDMAVDLIEEYDPAAFAVDVGGIGGPIVDELRRRDIVVIAVGFGEAALKDQLYADRRTELWLAFKEFLKEGGCIGDWDQLRDDLVGPEIGEEGGKLKRLKLESKRDMKNRGLKSPDWADAGCLTFACKAARGDAALSRSRQRKRRRGVVVAHGVDYSVYGR